MGEGIPAGGDAERIILTTATHRGSPVFLSLPFQKQGSQRYPVTGKSLLQWVLGSKNMPFRTPLKGNYFWLKRAYFSSPCDNGRIFSSGGHFTLSTCSPKFLMIERSPIRAWFDYRGDEVTLPGGNHARTRAGETYQTGLSELKRGFFLGFVWKREGYCEDEAIAEKIEHLGIGKTVSGVDEGIQYCMNNRSDVETFRQRFETIDPLYNENGIYTILKIIQRMI